MAPLEIQLHNTLFDYGDPTKNKITPESIAHALSNIARFGGHSDRWYSVGQHVCFVFDFMQRENNSEYAIYGLHHDDSEIVLGDFPTPFKRYMQHVAGIDIRGLFEPFDAAIYQAMGLSWPLSDELKSIIKFYDELALMTEKKYLWDEQANWGWGDEFKNDIPAEDIFNYYYDWTKQWDQEYLIRHYNKDYKVNYNRRENYV